MHSSSFLSRAVSFYYTRFEQTAKANTMRPSRGLEVMIMDYGLR